MLGMLGMSLREHSSTNTSYFWWLYHSSMQLRWNGVCTTLWAWSQTCHNQLHCHVSNDIVMNRRNPIVHTLLDHNRKLYHSNMQLRWNGVCTTLCAWCQACHNQLHCHASNYVVMNRRNHVLTLLDQNRKFGDMLATDKAAIKSLSHRTQWARRHTWRVKHVLT